jgi:hypothetical protein
MAPEYDEKENYPQRFHHWSLVCPHLIFTRQFWFAAALLLFFHFCFAACVANLCVSKYSYTVITIKISIIGQKYSP